MVLIENFPSLCFNVTIAETLKLHSKGVLLTIKKCLGDTVRQQTHHLSIIFPPIGKVFAL